jgi:hypothetical protein
MEFEDKIDDECAFHREGMPVCSSSEVVKKLKSLLDETIADVDAVKMLQAKYKCPTERCLMEQNEIKQVLGSAWSSNLRNFKSVGPRRSSEWLDNFSIDKTLELLQLKHPTFYHIRYQMIDFGELCTELCKLNWTNLYNEGFRTFGAVVNTDYSSGSGVHWFALFGDFRDENKVFTIEYFNSTGDDPMPQIAEWFKRFKNRFGKDFKKPIQDVVATKIQNQEDTHSCGPYSLYYIISRVEGVPCLYFRKNRIGDNVMHLFRKYIFSDDKSDYDRGVYGATSKK